MKKQVLVVQDIENLWTFYEHEFENEFGKELELTFANSVNSAQESIWQNEFDLILCDLSNASCFGMAIVKFTKELYREKAPHFIIVTSFTSKLQGNLNGVQVLQKPLEFFPFAEDIRNRFQL